MSEYNIVVLGDGGVGKSCCTIYMVQKHFVEEYDPTIEDSYRKRCVIDGDSCVLDILDTASGSCDPSPYQEAYCRIADGFLLVFSVTNRPSFDSIARLYNEILRYKDTDKVPAIICGNKVDLKELRQVMEHEAVELGDALGIPYLELSAKDGTNVENAFYNLCRLIRIQSEPILPQKHSNQRRK